MAVAELSSNDLLLVALLDGVNVQAILAVIAGVAIYYALPHAG